MGIFSGIKQNKLKRAIQKYPDDIKNYRELLRVYMEENDRDAAAGLVRDALRRSWSSPHKEWLQLQNIRLTSSGTDQLRMLLDLLRDQDGPADIRWEILDLLVEDYSHLPGDPAVDEPVLTALAEVIQSSLPGSKDPRQALSLEIYLANIESRLGRTESAAALMESVTGKLDKIKIKNKGQIYLQAAGISGKMAARSSKTAQYLKLAVESGDLNDQQTVRALTTIGDLLHQAEDLLGAMEKYETALRFSGPHSNEMISDVRLKLARCYGDMGRLPQARKEASLALAATDLPPDKKWSGYMWFAEFEFSQEHFDAAESNAESALEIAEPGDHFLEAVQMLTRIQSRAGRAEKSIPHLARAVEMAGETRKSEFEFALARSYTANGEPHKSLKILHSLSKVDSPVNAFAIAREQAEAYLAQQRGIKALEKFLEIVENAPESSTEFTSARHRLNSIRKQLATPDGVQRLKIDSSDKKYLASLLARIPDEDDLITRLKKGLNKTKSGLIGGIEKILSGQSEITDELLDDIEELLILSDLGVETTRRIVDGLWDKFRKKELADPEFVRTHIRSEIGAILEGASGSIEPKIEAHPYVIMVVGVNGVGKTTTIAKIAKRFVDQGKGVMMAAGDTFRAGAIEQLQEWGRRLDVEVVAQDEGSDPSAVAWDAVAAAKRRNADILILDTAGRLHTKSNLMEELKKIRRVVDKNSPGAPHEVLLVLDATTGQNAITQARMFSEATDVTGIVLTKLDGTAKGGIIVGIVETLNIPVKLIGIGERMDDLKDFEPETFTRALFED